MRTEYISTAPPPVTSSRRRLSAIAGALRGAAAMSWAEPELRGLPQLVRAGDICFDIGAAYGMYSFSLAQLVGSSGAVYSFEPQPKPRRVLRTGIRASGLDNVHVMGAAVGDRPGELEMALPVKFGIAPIHGHAHVNDGVRQDRPNSAFTRTRSWPTPIRSVDEFCAENSVPRVDFMKIDVEGFEPTVIAGARDIIEANRPTLLLEIEDRHLSRYSTNAEEFTATLRELGYRMHVWKPDEWVPAGEVTPDRRNYLFTSEALRQP
ncbi:FkbM family methyltransferase [Saccharopolyspora mangrovi]|uniref:FkbM family methyltransferase n=1 Tax=Saccharopolyspora mangrovi TaxID=3082379 RepID=A0ABU6A7S5_9PSEU|nr:FkbM family methyltransferase [Saccharopolyspora sp. S2-29]MEB3367550.1 FkbM family methyltransferase [Saccharopolyspora sp. S2-29]